MEKSEVEVPLGEETGIACFRCEKRSGRDCPGRQPAESTLCDPCLLVHILELRLEQAKHLLGMLDRGEITVDQFYEFSGE